MPHVNKAKVIFLLAERFKHTINPIPGQPEDSIHTTRHKSLYQGIGRIHGSLLFFPVRAIPD
jgi:hypothetical protein